MSVPVHPFDLDILQDPYFRRFFAIPRHTTGLFALDNPPFGWIYDFLCILPFGGIYIFQHPGTFQCRLEAETLRYKNFPISAHYITSHDSSKGE